MSVDLGGLPFPDLRRRAADAIRGHLGLAPQGARSAHAGPVVRVAFEDRLDARKVAVPDFHASVFKTSFGQ